MPDERQDADETRRRRKYRVYVVRLRNAVWTASARYRKANPDYIEGKPHVYVGSTSLKPQARFEKHKAGGPTSNRLVRVFGRRVMESETEQYRPRKSRSRIERFEAQVALEYRARGWGVWYNADPVRLKRTPDATAGPG